MDGLAEIIEPLYATTLHLFGLRDSSPVFPRTLKVPFNICDPY